MIAGKHFIFAILLEPVAIDSLEGVSSRPPSEHPVALCLQVQPVPVCTDSLRLE